MGIERQAAMIVCVGAIHDFPLGYDFSIFIFIFLLNQYLSLSASLPPSVCVVLIYAYVCAACYFNLLLLM